MGVTTFFVSSILMTRRLAEGDCKSRKIRGRHAEFETETGRQSAETRQALRQGPQAFSKPCLQDVSRLLRHFSRQAIIVRGNVKRIHLGRMAIDEQAVDPFAVAVARHSPCTVVG